MKNCSRTTCAQINPQPLDQFIRRTGKDGSRYKFDACRPECKSCYNQDKKNYYDVHVDMFRGKLLKKKYWPHLSWQHALKEYDRLWQQQSGTCKICKKPEQGIDPRSNETKMLAVDHIRGTFTIRGLLCQKCNRAIGLLEDDAARCHAVGDYLSQFSPARPYIKIA